MYSKDSTIRRRKHLGLCDCQKCRRRRLGLVPQQLRRRSYEEFLKNYAKMLLECPEKYCIELRLAEDFVAKLGHRSDLPGLPAGESGAERLAERILH